MTPQRQHLDKPNNKTEYNLIYKNPSASKGGLYHKSGWRIKIMNKVIILGLLSILITVNIIDTLKGDNGYDNIIIKNEKQITNDNIGQKKPFLYGDTVVWMDNRLGHYMTFTYDLNTEIESNLMSSNVYQDSAKISNRNIVWIDGSDGTPDLLVYNLDTKGHTYIITNDTFDAISSPDIFNDIVVWEGGYLNGTGSVEGGIYAYNLTNQTEFPICTHTSKQTDPVIWGDWVVWTDYRNGDADIYAYNLHTGEERAIASDYGQQVEPEIWGDYVIYNDQSQNPWMGYYYNLTSGEKKEISEGGGTVDAIWGDIIVWRGQNHVWLYNITLEQSYALDNGVYENVDIYANRLVYVEDGDVYLLEFEFNSVDEPIFPPVSSLELYQLIILAGITLFLVVFIVAVIWKKRKDA